VRCDAARCSASFQYDGPPGWFDLRVQYFDTHNGVARFRAFLGAQLVDEWSADDNLPTVRIDASSSTRRMIAGLPLRPGDVIRIEGTPDAGDAAALDYIEILPAGSEP
jgi:alpha-glucuronidase